LTALVFREQVEVMNARGKIGSTRGSRGKCKKKREIEGSNEAVKSANAWHFCDGWTDYLLSARGLSAGTVSRYRRLVERLLADCGKPFPEVSRADVEKHLRRLHLAGRGESVRLGVVAAVRSLGAWCLAHGHVEVNPGASLSGPRPYRREIKVLTVGEVSRLLWGDRPGTLPREPVAMRDRVLLGVAYMAGLRASEIGPLEAEGVMWHSESQVFSILVRRGKAAGGDVRLPLDRQVSRMLGMWLTARGTGRLAGRFLWGRSLTRWGVRKILLRRCVEVGIEVGGRRLSPHVLRHSLATHLLAEGLDLRQVQLLMRHRSIATTEQYLHADVDRLGAVLARRSPLEARGRRKAGALRPAMAQLLEELRGIGRAE
jgi:site-specific recombinase XerD